MRSFRPSSRTTCPARSSWWRPRAAAEASTFRRWEALLEGEGRRARTVPREPGQPFAGLLDRRKPPCGNPPQHHVRPLRLGEPLAALVHHRRMARAIDEIEQRLDALPNRHVDDHALAERPERGRVIALALEAPDEA